jgi:PAS domain S-box-containing protein
MSADASGPPARQPIPLRPRGREVGETDRQTQTVLAETEERYGRLLDLSLDAIVVHLGGRILHANAAAARLVGAAASEELLGRSVLDFVHPDSRPAVIERMHRAAEAGSMLDPLEEKLVRLDGSIIDVVVSGATVTFGGRPAIQVLIRDLTDRRRTAAALDETERRFRQLFESSLDAVAINILPEGRYLEVNDEFARLTGYRREEVLGHTPTELGIWVDPSIHDEAMKELRRLRVVRNVEARLRQKDGSIGWILYSAVIVEVASQPAILSFARNISALKQAEEELARARDQALEASRIKSAFLSNMSHEIRTPLNVILGYTALISDHLNELGDATQQPLFGAIRAAGKRLVGSIDAILDLSKIESGMFRVHPHRLRLRPILEGIFEEYGAIARKKGLSLSLAFRIDDPIVEFDEYCFRQAVSHLLDNAIKFTDRGSVVASLAQDPDDVLFFEIRDTGVGIDRDYLSRLFEPFSQESSGDSRRFEGTGVSLALTRRYLELNGATITVESQKRWGSTFRIRFARSMTEREEPGAAPLRPLVLVVEDDPDSQTYMKLLLRNHYEVLVASNVEEARRLLADRGSEIRVVLMDLSLGGPENGLSLTRALRANPQLRRVPIIVTTAHALAEYRSTALAAGCDAYLSKPFDYEELLSLMRTMVAKTEAV